MAPYNLARRCIGERVPDGVRVGTVDKFQGQEAPVVFFAMTCSSGEDVPRGLDSSSTATASTSPSRARSASRCSSTRRGCSTRTAGRSSDGAVDGACRFVELAGAEPVVPPVVA